MADVGMATSDQLHCVLVEQGEVVRGKRDLVGLVT